MALKYFNRHHYASLNEALSAIKRELTALWDREAPTTEDTVGSTTDSYIPEIPAEPSDADYTGMFKIERISNDDGTWKLHVYDTYSDQNLRLAGQCMVNNHIMDVSEWESENYNSGSGTILVLLHYNFIDGKGTVTVTSSIEAGLSSTYPTASNTEAWYLLGRVTDDTIQQDHLGGMPQILWFYRCEDE
jgi:hypothetical protein